MDGLKPRACLHNHTFLTVLTRHDLTILMVLLTRYLDRFFWPIEISALNTGRVVRKPLILSGLLHF